MQVSRTGPRPELLARVVGKVNSSMVEAALLADKLPVVRRNTADLLFDDELFEAAFDQLEEDDRMEFRDLVDEQERKRCRAKKALRTSMTFAAEQSKRKASGPLPKRRAKRARLKVQVEAMPSGEAGPAGEAGPLSSPEALGGLVASAPELDVAAAPSGTGCAGPSSSAGASDRAGIADAAPVASVRRRKARDTRRVTRSHPWGPWSVAPIVQGGSELIGYGATCGDHENEGEKTECKRQLRLGTKGGAISEEECRCRLKAWLLLGQDIPDGPECRSAHMAIQPREIHPLLPESEYDRLAAALPV